MRWTPGQKNDDVIDKRGERTPAGMGGGLGGIMTLIPLLLRMRYGWVIALVVVGVSFLGGGGLFNGRQPTTDRATGVTGVQQTGRVDDKQADFVGFVLNDVQNTWQKQFESSPVPYRHAKLVLFTDATQTACGFGQSATGPFYCPKDERVYIDLGFYNELEHRFGARGDFAQAYVIAHEVGHHVQNILGISERLEGEPRAALTGATGLSVRLELQADCFAGVWAHFTKESHLLEQGDLEEGINAAAAIGDDRLQRQATGAVNPESWTHGSSEERARWFRRGYDKGTAEACDTFKAGEL